MSSFLRAVDSGSESKKRSRWPVIGIILAIALVATAVGYTIRDNRIREAQRQEAYRHEIVNVTFSIGVNGYYLWMERRYHGYYGNETDEGGIVLGEMQLWTNGEEPSEGLMMAARDAAGQRLADAFGWEILAFEIYSPRAKDPDVLYAPNKKTSRSGIFRLPFQIRRRVSKED